MNLGGAIFMVVSVGFVLGLLAWCFKRVMQAPGGDR